MFLPNNDIFQEKIEKLNNRTKIENQHITIIFLNALQVKISLLFNTLNYKYNNRKGCQK